MTEIHELGAVELAAAIRDKRVGCREALEHYLERVDRLNPTLNAVIAENREVARERADAADAALARSESWGPLHGLPMTVKDSYEVTGMTTVCGEPSLRDHRSKRNAVAVQRLLDAGAVIFGKTNTPRMAQDIHQQSLGHHAHAGRLLRRFGGGHRRVSHRAGTGQRHRRLHPHAGSLVRGLRS
jgi:amidase